MSYINEARPFLDGNKFTDQYMLNINQKFPDKGRWSILKEITKNKKVVHVGCLDHIPLIEQRVKNNEWLHKNLTDNAKKCIGIDTNEEGVQYVKSKFNYNNIISANIAQDIIPELKDDEWDYILLGEVLEHIDNPVSFLQSIKRNYSNIKDIIVTVPNILNNYNYKLSKKGVEIINSDHRFWFTPYTIMKLLSLAEIEISKLEFANTVPLTFLEKISFKTRQLIKLPIEYKFNYFKNLIAIGKI